MKVIWRVAGIIAYIALIVITVRLHSYWVDAVFWLVTLGGVGTGLIHEWRGRATGSTGHRCTDGASGG